ncbi:hypothetical protein GCM10009555_056070 [Acrocarpospora macrocephala]|uniref:Uncharacterized protein n=1 Tax=Acrocarpospora macrocephala TaxID=150177 RepID=A0A5M3WH96_9ACTN|nr:hypothetical protein [Acrocarpospora macrocephala]GES08507.1 hypothetical protein Amac_021030 [Acrocarpospora macrocephala]
MITPTDGEASVRRPASPTSFATRNCRTTWPAHESQTGHIPDLDKMLKTFLATHAANGGLPEGSYAEAFQVVPTG